MIWNRRLRWVLPLILVLHLFLSWRLLAMWWSPPVLLVEMSSTIASTAKVYFDRGSNLNEADSSQVPVLPQSSVQTLRLPLPNAVLKFLRFDPVHATADIVIYRAVVLRSDGSIAATFLPSQIHEMEGFDRREALPNALRLHVSRQSMNPQLGLDLPAPLDLTSRFRGIAGLLRVALWNIPLLVFEFFMFFVSLRLLKSIPRPGFLFASLLAFHVVISLGLLSLLSSPPQMLVEMSSSVTSRAQVYWDSGAGMSEDQSSSQPVRQIEMQSLRLPLPYSEVRALRFDPLTCPGTIIIRRAAILRADGSAVLEIEPHSIHGLIGFDKMEPGPAGLLFHIREDSDDPQLAVDLPFPLDLRSHYPGNSVLARIVLINAAFLFIEILLFSRSRARTLWQFADTVVQKAAAGLSTERFLVFDRLAIWLYAVCIALLIVFTLADLNGSSMGIFWTNYKAGAPPRILAGVPQGIRADEFNYQTPGMLNEYFRLQRYEVAETAPGNHSVGLLAELPVSHITTLVRPQFWPFFVLPADYAFAAWWQCKWFLMGTGVFTLMLLLTRSSGLALTGTVWLLFSQFTQWCFSWPSMLPEMAGLFCFALVFTLYLTVGSHRSVLAVCAVLAAGCAVNFALCAYVPHQIPYFWAGVSIAVAWCVAHRHQILQQENSLPRILALLACFALIGLLLFTVFSQTREAVAGIAATIYPGHRSLSGGEFSLTSMGTHFLVASESATRFPPEYSNINEASGFLWLAPFTLLSFGRMRALPPERRILLCGLWAASLLLAAWMLLPVPASLGRLLFLDRVQAVRCLPALGFLNIAIVMLVLSGDYKRRGMEFTTKLTIAVPAAFVVLFIVNQNVHDYFRISELLVGALWASILIALLVEGRRLSFAIGVVVPNVLLFALINPVQRGIDTITATPLFDIVQHNPKLREGKWLVFAKGYPAAIFTAVGCDVYNGMRYLPDIDHFPLLARHGIDTNILNNLGYLNFDELSPGQPPSAKKGPYGPILGLSPLDPLIKELGIRYMAFHKRPSAAVLAHLKPVIAGNVSEFWLYELQ